MQRALKVVVVVALIAAAWAGLQLYGLDLTPFHTTGEPREAVVVQDLIRHGNWILPRRNGVELPRKPPLFYWLGGAAAHVRGTVDEASVRLPSAVLSGAACVLVAAVVTVLYGTVAGATAGFTLLTSFEWLRAATAARVDMTLTFGLALVFVGLLLFRRSERPAWLLLMYGGAAWATLSKGIPGLAIPALMVVALCLLVDRSLAFAWRLRPLIGVPAVLVICAAWYVAAGLQGGRSFVTIAINENLVRAVGARAGSLGHEHSVFYLVGSLAAGLLPWTVLLPSVGWALWRDRGSVDRRDPRLFALLWVAIVFAPFAVATSKRGVYLLPLYPAVSLLLGWWATELFHGRLEARWLRGVLVAFGWVLGAMLGLLTLLAGAQAVGLSLLDSAAALFDPRTAEDIRLVAAASRGEVALCVYLAIAAAAAIGWATAAGLRRWAVALAAIAVCTAALVGAVRTVILPAIGEGYTRRPFALALRRAVGDASQVHTGSSLDYGTLFYWGAAMPEYDRERDAEPPQYLLVPESAWLHMSAAERRRFHRIAGLRVPRTNSQGYPAVLERTAPPVAPSDLTPER